MTIENIKQLMDNLDIAALLPDIMSVMNGLVFLAQIALLATPLAMLGLGMYYFLIAPKEANYHFGYRCYFGMGSIEAWRFTQRIAGIGLGSLGLVLTVVMGIICMGFENKEAVQLLDTAVICLIWEAALAAVAYLAITIVVTVTFDKYGYRRR